MYTFSCVFTLASTSAVLALNSQPPAVLPHVMFASGSNVYYLKDANGSSTDILVAPLAGGKARKVPILFRGMEVEANRAASPLCWRIGAGRVWWVNHDPYDGQDRLKIGNNSGSVLESGPLKLHAGVAYYYAHVGVMESMFFTQIAARRDRPGNNIFCDFLPRNATSGMLFTATDMPFVKPKQKKGGGLIARSFEMPDKEPPIQWQITLHAFNIDYDPKNDLLQEDYDWDQKRSFASLFLEPFTVTEINKCYYFFTSSGKVFDVPKADKAPKMKRSFDPGKNWKFPGLLVHADKNQAAAVGWNGAEKKALCYFLGDTIEMTRLSLAKEPTNANELLLGCARVLYGDKAAQEKKEK